jgi:hypothetical protein
VGAGLDQDVADRGRLGRPGDHRQAAAVGGELAEQLVLRAAADHVHRIDRPTGQFAGLDHDRGVRGRQ